MSQDFISRSVYSAEAEIKAGAHGCPAETRGSLTGHSEAVMAPGSRNLGGLGVVDYLTCTTLIVKIKHALSRIR